MFSILVAFRGGIHLILEVSVISGQQILLFNMGICNFINLLLLNLIFVLKDINILIWFIDFNNQLLSPFLLSGIQEAYYSVEVDGSEGCL